MNITAVVHVSIVQSLHIKFRNLSTLPMNVCAQETLLVWSCWMWEIQDRTSLSMALCSRLTIPRPTALAHIAVKLVFLHLKEDGLFDKSSAIRTMELLLAQVRR
jgi:hypothetical protein